MEFIKIAYCVTIPLLLLFIWTGKSIWKNYAVNLLSVSNILLMGNSVFLIRQLLGAYQLGKQFSKEYTHISDLADGFMIRVLLVIFLPILTLNSHFRKSQIFSLVLVALLFWTFPVYSWNTYNLLFKIPCYLCLLCSGYALGWLLNKLPYQSSEA